MREKWRAGVEVHDPGNQSTEQMKVGIIACGAIVRELTAIAEHQGWDYELTAVPAQLHNRPERIAPAVEKKLDAWARRFDLILVGYADCGTGGALDALLQRYPHAMRIPGPHCYEFYGGDLFVQQAERQPGTFYLTDFLARHFEGLVIKGLGLDRFPELRDAYFGNYEELLYLRQSAQNDESERAQQAAQRLDLHYQEADTGLGELEQRILALIEETRKSRSTIGGRNAMPRTVEAAVDQDGTVEDTALPAARRALVTILEEESAGTPRPIGLCDGEFVVPEEE